MLSFISDSERQEVFMNTWNSCIKMNKLFKNENKNKISMQFQIKISEFQDLPVPVCLRNWLKCST